MCKQAIVDLRPSGGFTRGLTVGTTALTAASEASDRIALILGAPVAGRITYSTDPGVTDGLGLVLASGAGPLVLLAGLHGSLVRSPWYAIADMAGRTAGVAETLMRT